jgi:hypothetical protein
MEMWKQFGEMGLLGITCSSEYGGLDMGYFMHVIAMEGKETNPRCVLNDGLTGSCMVDHRNPLSLNPGWDL